MIIILAIQSFVKEEQGEICDSKVQIQERRVYIFVLYKFSQGESYEILICKELVYLNGKKPQRKKKVL